MKKALSLVLVLVMVLGLTVPAFAKTDVKCVTFTLNDYVDDRTPMSIASVTVDPDSVSVNKQKFMWFYCISGDSSYVNYVEDGVLTGWQKIEYDTELKLSTGTPDLNNGALFAMVSIDLNNGDGGFGDDFVLKYGNREIPLVSTLINPEDYEDDTEYVTAYYAYTYTPTDEFWTWKEDEISACVKIFDTTSESSTKSGTTTITATKEAAELAYTIVIPTATTLTEEAHKNVRLGGDNGKASITVTTPSDKTNVYYTVDLTNGTLTSGTNTITTSYAYAQGGDYAELTDATKVTVYEGGTVKDSTVQVTADDTAWAAAPAGDYAASVVFNFATEEAEAPAAPTAADALVENAQYKLEFSSTAGGGTDFSITFEKTSTGFALKKVMSGSTDVTQMAMAANMASSTASGTDIVFDLSTVIITVLTSTNTYTITGNDAGKTTFASFSVKPAGATEFTQITLTKAE